MSYAIPLILLALFVLFTATYTTDTFPETYSNSTTTTFPVLNITENMSNMSEMAQTAQCDNIFQQIGFLQPVGEFLCFCEHLVKGELQSAGYDAFHVIFYVALLLLVLIFLNNIFLKGTNAGLGWITLAGVFIFILILFGVV